MNELGNDKGSTWPTWGVAAWTPFMGPQSLVQSEFEAPLMYRCCVRPASCDPRMPSLITTHSPRLRFLEGAGWPEWLEIRLYSFEPLQPLRVSRSARCTESTADMCKLHVLVGSSSAPAFCFSWYPVDDFGGSLNFCGPAQKPI